MIQLIDKYQPRKVEDFIGIPAPKAMLAKLVADPYPSSWLLMGGSGTGKSSIGGLVAMAITKAPSLNHPGYGLHHMKSADCSVDAIDRMIRECDSPPMVGGAGGMRVCLVEEAGSMSPSAQKAWLSILDPSGMPPDTIIIFTGNEYVIGANGRITPHALKDRFLARVRRLNFTPPTSEELVDFLRSVWEAESNRKVTGKRPGPDFAAIAADAHGNIRSALMTLETELMVPGSFVPAPIVKAPIILATKSTPESSNHHAQTTENEELRQRRSDAAKRAWANSPKLQSMRKRA